jgi:predicted aconitase
MNDNNNNNEFNNKEEMNDFGAFNGSSSNIDLYYINNYKPHRELRDI